MTPVEQRDQAGDALTTDTPAPVRWTFGGSSLEPLWFGPEDRSRFGWLYRPEHPVNAGVVLCPSIGLEAEPSQLAFRSLAPALADSGLTVLRFDYDGTGDSVGTLVDPDRVDAWVESIVDGLDLLRKAGIAHLHLVGAKLGATLAARTLSRVDDVDSVTLWYPWVTGRQFLRYQKALRRMEHFGPDPGLDTDAVELNGSVLDGPTASEVSELRVIDHVGAFPDDVLVVGSKEDFNRTHHPDQGVSGRWTWQGGTGARHLFEVDPVHAAVDPADVEAIVAYITSRRPLDPVVPAPEVGRSVAVVNDPRGDSREYPVRIGDGGLFGVMTEPVPSERSGATANRYRAALFLNAGSLLHIGPARQWVDLSRSWAAEGMRCLRIDLDSLGDSPSHGGEPPIHPEYPVAAMEDIDAAVRFLSPVDPRDVVIVGLCSGSYHGAMFALQSTIGGLAVINPTRFRPPTDGPEPLAVAADGSGGTEPAGVVSDYLPKRPRTLVDLGALRGRKILRPVIEHLPEPAWWAVNRLTGASLPALTIRRLVNRGTTVFAICGPDEPAVHFARGERRTLRGVTRPDGYTLSVVDGLDHNFYINQGRRGAVDLLHGHLFGTRSDPDAPMVPTD